MAPMSAFSQLSFDSSFLSSLSFFCVVFILAIGPCSILFFLFFFLEHSPTFFLLKDKSKVRGDF